MGSEMCIRDRPMSELATPFSHWHGPERLQGHGLESALANCTTRIQLGGDVSTNNDVDVRTFSAQRVCQKSFWRLTCANDHRVVVKKTWRAIHTDVQPFVVDLFVAT